MAVYRVTVRSRVAAAALSVVLLGVVVALLLVGLALLAAGVVAGGLVAIGLGLRHRLRGGRGALLDRANRHAMELDPALEVFPASITDPTRARPPGPDDAAQLVEPPESPP